MNRDIDEANSVASGINALNAKGTAESEHAAAVVVAVVIGALLACALLHWWEPCAEASLCAALITPTRRCWRLTSWVRVLMARWRLADAESALEWVEDDLHTLPLIRNTLAAKVDVLRVQLADAEQARRGG